MSDEQSQPLNDNQIHTSQAGQWFGEKRASNNGDTGRDPGGPGQDSSRDPGGTQGSESSEDTSRDPGGPGQDTGRDPGGSVGSKGQDRDPGSQDTGRDPGPR